jgi:hypothetical protein
MGRRGPTVASVMGGWGDTQPVVAATTLVSTIRVRNLIAEIRT